LKSYRLDITSLGDAQSRASHRIDLVEFISKLNLDEATRARSEINPLRLFDDKREEIIAIMADAPLLLNYLSKESKESFAKVQELLARAKIDYVINPRMVRGLDYYTGTTFEFVSEKLGAQSGIGGGGRYDGLMAELGGDDLSGIGFGLGVDRILLACEAEGVFDSTLNNSELSLFLIALGPEEKVFVSVLLNDLRDSGISCDMAYGDRSLKGAMKSADRSGARYSLVIGPDEISSGNVLLKEMRSGESKEVRIASLIEFLTPSNS
jgi:histidyl-tRNA synthetase